LARPTTPGPRESYPSVANPRPLEVIMRAAPLLLSVLVTLALPIAGQAAPAKSAPPTPALPTAPPPVDSRATTPYRAALLDNYDPAGGETLESASRKLRQSYTDAGYRIGETVPTGINPTLTGDRTLLDIYRAAGGKGHLFAPIAGRFWTAGEASYA